MKKLSLVILSLSSLLLSATAIDQAMMKIFDTAQKIDNTRNVLLSPWGIEQCFSMAACGADKNSAAELQKFLGIDAESMKKMRDARISLKNCVAFNSFNAVLFSSNECLLQTFVNQAADLCGSRFFQLDFSRKSECADALNNIIKTESRGMFDKVFKEEDLNGDPMAILLNVLHFKGAWAVPFQEFNTSKAPFHIPGEAPENVDMMYQKSRLPYYNDGKFHAVIMPYKGDAARFKMLAIMPIAAGDPLTEVTGFIAAGVISRIINAASAKYETEIHLPKLKLETENDLKALFQKIGMNIIFDPVKSDLNKMVEGHPVFVEKTKQLVKLNMDEAGTEVAAVTYAIMSKAMAAPPEKSNVFMADRPFVLILFDSETETVMLAAAINNPVK